MPRFRLLVYLLVFMGSLACLKMGRVGSVLSREEGIAVVRCWREKIGWDLGVFNSCCGGLRTALSMDGLVS